MVVMVVGRVLRYLEEAVVGCTGDLVDQHDHSAAWVVEVIEHEEVVELGKSVAHMN